MKVIKQSCKCDSTSRMIEEGVIFISDLLGTSEKIFVYYSDRNFAIRNCFKCGKPLTIQEEGKSQSQKDIDNCKICDDDGKYSPTGGIGIVDSQEIKCDHFLKAESEKWEDLPEDNEYYFKYWRTDCDVTVEMAFAKAINKIGRDVEKLKEKEKEN